MNVKWGLDGASAGGGVGATVGEVRTTDRAGAAGARNGACRGTVGVKGAVDRGFCGTGNAGFASGHINESIETAAAIGW